MEYRIIRTGEEPDSFEHALFGGGRQKGAQNKNHKYLARAWWRNKWRYAYTEAEVRALQMLGKAKETASDVKKTAEKTATKVKGTVNVASGQAKKAVDTAKNTVQKTAYETSKAAQKTAKEVSVKAKGTANVATGQAKKAVNTAKNTVEKTAYNASKAAKEVVNDVKLGTTAKQVAIKAETAKNDIKNTANKVSNSAKAAAEKVTSTAKTVTEKGKAKAEELLSNTKKENTSSSSPTRQAPSSSEVTRGRKYEGTGHKAEARKEEGGVSGGPVSGNTNMQGRGEEKEKKKESLKEKASNFVKKASAAAEAVKTGAYISKKNKENYLNDDNNKVVTDTAGKSTLKGQKVTTSYSEGDSLFNKSTLTKKKNADGTVEYEHHTEYGKIAQATKKGKETVENLFGKNKANGNGQGKEALEFRRKKNFIEWLTTSSNKDQNDSNRSLSETMEKGKSKAQEVLNKVSSTAKTTAAKVYDKVTDDIEKVRESDAVAVINNTTNKVKDKVSDTAEKVTDKVADKGSEAKHIADATKAKVRYGSNSLQYKEAAALIDHDKAVNAVEKARDKYGVNSTQYKQAVANEKQVRENWQEVREQNLYKNNKEYRTYSDRASYLGSRIDAIDASGGPKTPEGKASYQQMLKELRGLESKLDSMKRG
jgi:hypothetical protein